jgi:hypothetical protein
MSPRISTKVARQTSDHVAATAPDLATVEFAHLVDTNVDPKAFGLPVIDDEPAPRFFLPLGQVGGS